MISTLVFMFCKLYLLHNYVMSEGNERDNFVNWQMVCFELPSSVIKKRAIKFEASLKSA